MNTYSGHLNCNTLDQDLANFSRLLVGRFCVGASQACEIQKMRNRLETSPCHCSSRTFRRLFEFTT